MRTGLQRIADGDAAMISRLAGRRLGLLAHPASVDRDLRHASQVLGEAGCHVAVLFGPEHGYGGEVQDMVSVASNQAAEVPVYSLYGDRFEDLTPKAEWLQGLDAIVIDLQDVGSRYYTYVWTAVLMLKAAAKQSIPTIVLDRPNPLGGVVVEGAPQRAGYTSFVGLYDVPVRHGLTLGELCLMVVERERLPNATLEVITMTGYERGMTFQACDLPWVLPSPNMPTLDTARVYPGGCLLEGTNLSEGRGTTRPFEVFGAPFLDGAKLAAAVQMPGVRLRPLTFLPMFQKHGGTLCGGVQVHVTEPAAFRSYALYLQLIAAAFRLSDEARFRTEPYEFVADRPAIDLLTGGAEFRSLVEARADLGAYLAEQDQAAAAFVAASATYRLYV